MTQLLYIAMLAIAFGFAFYVQKSKKKRYIFVIIAIFTFIAGFRGISCGVDTPAYYEHIIKGFQNHWQFREEGFRFVSTLIMNVFNNPQLVFVLCAFVTNLLILFRLWDFKDDADYSFMILLYILLYYSNTMNIMRQYVAVALVFYGTRYLRKNKFLFISFVLVAFFFHRSSLLALGFLVISFWVGFSKKQKLFYFFPLSLVMIGIVAYIASYLASDIASYSSQVVHNLNIPYFYLLIITIGVIILQKKRVHVIMYGESASRFYLDFSKYLEIIYYVLIGLGLSGLSMFFSFVGRTGLYYSIFEIVFWGIACKRFKNYKLNKVLILIYAVYVFALVIFRNDYLLFPYSIYLYL